MSNKKSVKYLMSTAVFLGLLVYMIHVAITLSNVVMNGEEPGNGMIIISICCLLLAEVLFRIDRRHLSD